jgi:ubiquinone/menaquinone biosynthesis C-methylase UbiE
MGILKKYLRKFRYTKDFVRKKNRLENNRFFMPWSNRYPCLNDATSITSFDSHYLFHTAWAARVLSKNKPQLHIDISSCLRFVSLVSAFIPIDFYDYRPAHLNLSGLVAKKADLMNLPFESNSVESLSCMHVIEHIGLERYGDTFDPIGDLKAIAELKRVIGSNGNLLFVVPLGENPIIQYNAHRIYTFDQVLSYFSDLFLAEFAYVNDVGQFIANANKSDTLNQSYGCGCFHFKK